MVLTLIITLAFWLSLTVTPMSASIVSNTLICNNLVAMNEPDTCQVFSSLSVLGSLREAIFMMTQYVPTMISGKVSIDRVDGMSANWLVFACSHQSS